MKFAFSKGDYACFDGYTFLFGRPVEVTGITVKRLLNNPDYRRVESGEEKAQEAAPDATILKRGCPKCGRDIRRGLTMHTRYCKGMK